MTTIVTNTCKACHESWTSDYHDTKHSCRSSALATLYGGAERTYRNIHGTVLGWHEWRLCSVCNSGDVVALRAVGLQDRVWCARCVGKNRGTKRENPFAVFVAACY